MKESSLRKSMATWKQRYEKNLNQRSISDWIALTYTLQTIAYVLGDIKEIPIERVSQRWVEKE